MDSSVPPTSQPHPLRPYYEGSSTTLVFPSKPAASALPPASFPSVYAPENPAERVVDLNGLYDVLNSAVNATVLAFTGTALVMPFEVGKTLCQVQWVPRGTSQGVEEVAEPLLVEDDDEEEDVEAYFDDLSAPTTEIVAEKRPTSPSGYISRTDVGDPSTRPPWVLPVIIHGGVWDMMRGVSRFEGVFSLFRGLVTTTLVDTLASTIQPILFTTLSVLTLPSRYLTSALLPLMYSPHPQTMLAIATCSHALTSLLLSPLDLIRTRLIVQSPREKTYSGPLDALKKVTSEEGGLYTTYFHPTLLIPTLLEGVLRPLIQLSTPLVISRFLRIEPSTSPVLFCLAELVFSSGGLLITLPIETIRKRLQIQLRNSHTHRRTLKTTVETRPTPYTGVADCIYSIVTEESGGEMLKSPLRQLYRGLGMGLATNTIVCLLGLVVGRNEEAVGWAEV